MMHKALTGSACLSLSLLSVSTAVADDVTGIYISGNFGRARNGYDTNNIDSELNNGAAAAGDTLQLTNKSTTRLSKIWSADAGYFFTPYIGVEAAFIHLGQLRYIAVGNVSVPGGAIESLATTNEITSHGPAVSAVFRLPLSEFLEADLHLGDYFGKTTIDSNLIVNGAPDFVALAKTSSSLLAGVGAAYTFAAHYSIRIDYLRIEKTGDDATGGKFSVNVLTAGLSYVF